MISIRYLDTHPGSGFKELLGFPILPENLSQDDQSAGRDPDSDPSRQKRGAGTVLRHVGELE